jgi:hypothetical protein
MLAFVIPELSISCFLVTSTCAIARHSFSCTNCSSWWDFSVRDACSSNPLKGMKQQPLRFSQLPSPSEGWLPSFILQDMSLLGPVILLLPTFGSLFLLPETAFSLARSVFPTNRLPGLTVFLPRICSFLALCFFPPIWEPKLNSVTQSTLHILHQKEGIEFVLDIWMDGAEGCRTITFFFEGCQFVGWLRAVVKWKLNSDEGILLSGIDFLFNKSGVESVEVS